MQWIRGRKCFRPRREKGRLCKECHREYMKGFMAKKRGKGRERFVDGYDLNQDNYI